MNSIVHFELPAKNVKEAQKFYTDVFGWKFMDFPEMNYSITYTSEVDENHMPKTAGAVNGGMLTDKDNGGLNPVLVIDVPSVEDFCKKIEAAGGTITVPVRKVGDMGLYAKFTDPSGVVMGVWQSNKA